MAVCVGSQFRRSAIAELLRSQDISASELARRIGVSRQVVSMYRSGRKTPQLATVLRMSTAFDKPLDFFIEREATVEA